MHRPSLASLCVALAVLGAAPVAAQTCGVKAGFRLVNSCATASELNVDSGWVTNAPLTTPGTNSGSTTTGCFSNGNCTVVADYGRVHVTGTGSAASCSTNGVFLWLDEYFGGEPKGRFRDTAVVTAPGLPIGAPVQLRGTLQLAGFATVGGLSPFVAYSASLTLANASIATGSNATGTFNGVVNTTVGATIAIEGGVYATLHANGVLGFNQTGSYALDLQATFDVQVLTPGVSLVTCSGRRYDQLTASAVAVGTGCGAAPPSLVATAPVLGTNCALTVSGAPANATTMFGLALGPAVATPFGACTLQLDSASAVILAITAANVAGQAATNLAIPNTIGFAGMVLTTQALPFAANGPFLGLTELSNGVQLRLGN